MVVTHGRVLAAGTGRAIKQTHDFTHKERTPERGSLLSNGGRKAVPAEVAPLVSRTTHKNRGRGPTRRAAPDRTTECV